MHFDIADLNAQTAPQWLTAMVESDDALDAILAGLKQKGKLTFYGSQLEQLLALYQARVRQLLKSRRVDRMANLSDHLAKAKVPLTHMRFIMVLDTYEKLLDDELADIGDHVLERALVPSGACSYVLKILPPVGQKISAPKVQWLLDWPDDDCGSNQGKVNQALTTLEMHGLVVRFEEQPYTLFELTPLGAYYANLPEAEYRQLTAIYGAIAASK